MMIEDQSVILCDLCVTCTPAWRSRLRFHVPHYVPRHSAHIGVNELFLLILT